MSNSAWGRGVLPIKNTPYGFIGYISSQGNKNNKTFLGVIADRYTGVYRDIYTYIYIYGLGLGVYQNSAYLFRGPHNKAY